jgi:hypothetical protein
MDAASGRRNQRSLVRRGVEAAEWCGIESGADGMLVEREIERTTKIRRPMAQSIRCVERVRCGSMRVG